MTQAIRWRLNQALDTPLLSVMNFLNEVKINYPKAISFSAGRPAENFFNVRERLKHLDLFMGHLGEQTSLDGLELWGSFGQYGRTSGIICDLLADHLQKDEGMTVHPEDIVVTTGCQEAMALILIGLLSDPKDVLLTANPTYIGITGLARLMGIEVGPVTCNDQGMDLDGLENAIEGYKGQGKNPKAVYVIPDFNNPIGCDMPLPQRQRLLRIAQKYDLWILEDNPYGMFVYDGEKLPTIKVMDRDNRVIYMGTFSKTLFPSLRVGYLVSGATIPDDRGGSQRLSHAFSKIKSLTTVNTCALSQAVVGGVLLANGGSLKAEAEAQTTHYRRRRDAMLAALERAFPQDDPLRAQIHWNRPRGGFFMTVTLPFPFDDEALQACAENYDVILVPMRYFSLTPGREYQIRLSFCSNSISEINEGIAQLALFIRSYVPPKISTTSNTESTTQPIAS